MEIPDCDFGIPVIIEYDQKGILDLFGFFGGKIWMMVSNWIAAPG